MGWMEKNERLIVTKSGRFNGHILLVLIICPNTPTGMSGYWGYAPEIGIRDMRLYH